MRHFPAFLDLQGRPVALFGAGSAAVGKARLLSKSGASVQVFSASPLIGDLAALAAAGAVHHRTESPDIVDLSHFSLVISCAGDPVDTDVARRARALNIPVNVVDRPDLCSFIMPSIIDRGAVVAAVSTGGDAPVIARRLRERIEALLPAGIGTLAALMGRYRPPVMNRLKSVAELRSFWERIVDGPVAEAVFAGDTADAERQLVSAIADLPGGSERSGVLHIVGAGPGDPELLTLKALRVLQDADVIFHDALVPAAIVDLARRDADRIAVGRRAGAPGLGQTEINRILIAEVRSGKRVVRLKGGDPFIFGRGGEEAEAARAAGLAVHVIPGITAAIGLAAEAQIPLTHRDETASVTFLSAARRTDAAAAFDATHLPLDGTLAVYMGRREAATVARGLIAAGRAPETAVAVITDGARPGRRSRVGVLRELGRLAAEAGDGPALLIIGDVVRRSALWDAETDSTPLAAE